MPEQPDTAAIRAYAATFESQEWGNAVRTLCDALDMYRVADDESLRTIENLLARAEAAEARVVELERRLSPGQGEGYANEVERQRAVIEQFEHIARAQKARIARVEKELDRHRTPIPLPGDDGCSAVVVDVSAVRRALAVPPGDTVPFDF